MFIMQEFGFINTFEDIYTEIIFYHVWLHM